MRSKDFLSSEELSSHEQEIPTLDTYIVHLDFYSLFSDYVQIQILRCSNLVTPRQTLLP